MFHMYVGVRAGGGIGDQIEDPAGDEYEIYRIIFDITFFFFVIVILLAIIQGERSPTHTHTHTHTLNVSKGSGPQKVKHLTPVLSCVLNRSVITMEHEPEPKYPNYTNCHLITPLN